jgi:aminoglycoside phosphotransferase (APT) family kinase protein
VIDNSGTNAEATRERVRRALRLHAPELAGAPVSELGHGLDNTAFVAGDLVLRAGDGGSVAREARLLQRVGARVPVPVPAPRFADRENGVLAYPLLPGRPLLGRAAPAGSARLLGRFLRALHAIEPATLRDLVPTEDADPSTWLGALEGRAYLVARLRESVPPPGRRLVLAHADLGAEHILERDGALTGVIDWSDAAITDPALDFARLYRDFGPEFLAAALDAYGGLADAEAALARIRFFARCAALEDLAYGGAHADAAQRSLLWLFP